MRMLRVGKKPQGITLLELMIALCVVVISIFAVTQLCIFITRQVGIYYERGTMYTQLNFALEDIRLRCLSASVIEDADKFAAKNPVDKTSFCFYGEPNIYKIDPQYSKSAPGFKKVRYCYRNDTDKGFVLESTPSGKAKAEVEVLIDKKFAPVISFSRTAVPGLDLDNSPNFMFVKATLTSEIDRRRGGTAAGSDRTKFLSGLSNKISKIQGVRFWYVTVVKPKE